MFAHFTPFDGIWVLSAFVAGLVGGLAILKRVLVGKNADR